VFCTMTRCLDVLEEYLQWRGFGYERLDGATAAADRGAIIDSFNRPGGQLTMQLLEVQPISAAAQPNACSQHAGSSSFVFLLSMRAGGVGLNLQAADTVIMYDTDWNAQVCLQPVLVKQADSAH
jgi:SNF2 family DNA or RNA helicase